MDIGELKKLKAELEEKARSFLVEKDVAKLKIIRAALLVEVTKSSNATNEIVTEGLLVFGDDLMQYIENIQAGKKIDEKAVANSLKGLISLINIY